MLEALLQGNLLEEIGDIDIELLKEYMIQERVEIEGTTYVFEKFRGKKSFELSELIRVQFGFIMQSDIDIRGILDGLSKVIFNTPASFIEAIKEDLFEKVHFGNENTMTREQNEPRFRVVKDNEDMAFSDPFTQYEVIARSICVNFLDSGQRRALAWAQALKKLRKEKPLEDEDTKPLSQ